MLLVKTKIGQSKIHGIGLFADQFIKKGTPIWRFNPGLDLKITEEEFEKLPELAHECYSHYCYHSIVDNTYVLPFDDARFFNHSKKSNTTSIDVPDDPEGLEIASKDIKVGEEILCDCKEFDIDCIDGTEKYAKE
ncbi:MAG: SET domain-containing protein [Patescibacteria group bacterium]